VVIITNSDEGWVKYSCERFVPRLLPVLDQYLIVSARTHYERFYPGQPLCWKAAAFAHEVNEIFEGATNVVSDDDEDDGGLSSVQNDSYQSLESTDVSEDSGSSRIAIEKDGMSSSRRRVSISSPTPADRRTNSQAPSAQRRRQREIISFGDSMEERTAVRIVADQLGATAKSVMFVAAPTPGKIIGQLHMLANHMRYVCDTLDTLDLEITPAQADHALQTYLKGRQLSFPCEIGTDRELVRVLAQRRQILLQTVQSSSDDSDEDAHHIEPDSHNFSYDLSGRI
jgi:hypothetical protein